MARARTVVERIVHAWRVLTSPAGARKAGPGERTLVGCSGGADSSALAIALAGAGVKAAERVVIAHVVHDLRPAAEALADRDATAELARRLGVAFVEARVAVREARGNAEANARRARYAALARLARERGCRFVAVAHHADDQLETVLMALLRGAGPRGLGGMAARRRLAAGARAEDEEAGDVGARGVTLVRPMLGVTREEAESVCAGAGWAFRVDATNADTTRLRAALRHEVLPALRKVRPRAAERTAAAAELSRAAANVVERAARRLVNAAGERGGWSRQTLRRENPAVVGEMLRIAARAAGAKADRLTWRGLSPVVRRVRSASTEPGWVEVAGVRVMIDARVVRVEAAGATRQVRQSLRREAAG